MKLHIPKASFIFSLFGLLILILDGKTTITAASEGVNLCLYTVIPSLFPFFFICQVLTSALAGKDIPFLSSVGKLCHIPKGSEELILTGLLGGYPIGARSVRNAYDAGTISKPDAERLLGFCNNPGPAFLFGISGALFNSPLIPMCIYLIVVISSVFTGMILPGTENKAADKMPKPPASSIKNAISATASVCGWVILFKVILGILERWVFWLFPHPISVFFTGILELTNGCCVLKSFPNDFVKFILITVFMVFGGLCVALQTKSAAEGLSLKYYFKGKLLQTYIALLFTFLFSHILFPGNISPITTLIFTFPLITLTRYKISTGKRKIIGV